MERTITYTSNKVSYFFEKKAKREKDDTIYKDLWKKVNYLRKAHKLMIFIPKTEAPPAGAIEFYQTENKIWYIL